MKDIKFNKNFEIEIIDGDIFVDEIPELNNQYVNLLVSSNKGDMRSQPMLGLNLDQKINSKFDRVRFNRELDENMTGAGLQKLKWSSRFKGDKLEIKINTKRNA